MLTAPILKVPEGPHKLQRTGFGEAAGAEFTECQPLTSR
jgi:hypothetical protein